MIAFWDFVIHRCPNAAEPSRSTMPLFAKLYHFPANRWAGLRLLVRALPGDGRVPHQSWEFPDLRRPPVDFRRGSGVECCGVAVPFRDGQEAEGYPTGTGRPEA